MRIQSLKLTAALVGSAISIAVALSPSAAVSQEKLSVGMPTSPPNIVHMPIHIANDLGYFKEEGLEVEFLSFEGGVHSFRAMLSGDVDVGSSSGPFAIVGRSRGAKTKLIMANYPKLEVTMVVPNTIKTVQDLKGKRIGIQEPGGFAWVLSMMVLRSGGLGQDDVEFVSILSEDVPPLVAGQIDSAVLHVEQEMVAKSKRKDLHALARLWEVAPSQLYSAFAVKEDAIAKKRKALTALVKGHIRATRLMYTDPDKALPILVKHTGLDEKIVADAFKVMRDSCIWDANHGLTKERIDYTATQMEKVGNIEKGKKPSYDEIVDLSLAEDALKQLGMWKGPACPTS